MREPGVQELRIRSGRDADAQAFIALIGGCWAEYPGIVLDVDREVPELRGLASYYGAKGGTVWAAEADGAVVGMVAAAPLKADAAWEIARMYVARPWRGSGLAHCLLDTAEARARQEGAQRVVLWSDTRFAAAHHFYEKRSYVRAGPIRILDDLSKSLEFRYAKPLAGLAIEVLDAAAAASAERLLAAALIGAVAEGADLGFRAPLASERARAVWHDVTAAVAGGRRLLLVAWQEGVIAGSAEIDLALPETAPNHARLERLLVAPSWQRRGIGCALLARTEQAALRVGRRLLTGTVRAGDPAEHLLRTAGWEEAGKIPGATNDTAGTPAATVIFWRALA
ncbi:MAG: GNAT family N-acetyltransferase [Rhodospirillales bacterium]|nr:GNAT family N-acetyltransferase [Rhodospirillales bacterium]